MKVLHITTNYPTEQHPVFGESTCRMQEKNAIKNIENSILYDLSYFIRN